MSISIILGKVRDKIPLQKEEINEFSLGLCNGAVSDAQAAAFAMAVCLLLGKRENWEGFRKECTNPEFFLY